MGLWPERRIPYRGSVVTTRVLITTLRVDKLKFDWQCHARDTLPMQTVQCRSTRFNDWIDQTVCHIVMAVTAKPDLNQAEDEALPSLKHTFILILFIWHLRLRDGTVYL